MAVAFDQLLGSNQSKTSGNSLVISPSSKTVTVGKTIFVAFAFDEFAATTNHGIVDNLTNTYSLVKNQAPGSNTIRTQLWSAPVTTGGSITSITISWTTNITAKAAVAGEYSGFGALRLTDGANGTAGTTTGIASNTFFTDELWIAALGVEDNVAVSVSGTTGTPSQTKVSAGTNATSGGASASNIAVTLAHILVANDSTANAVLSGSNDGNQVNAGAGAIYDPVGGPVTHNAAAALTGTGAVTPAASLTLSGASAVSGSGAISPVAALTLAGASAFSGAVTMAAVGEKAALAEAVLAGTGAIAPDASVTYNGASALSGTGSVAAAADVALSATTALSGAASLASAAVMTYSGIIVLPGLAVLVAVGDVAAPAIEGEAALDGTGSMVAVAVITHAGAAVFPGAASMSAEATLIVAGASDLASGSFLLLGAGN